ncbi:hypothetical protein ACTACM_25320 [Pseudomonas fragariae (ex Marin et al. 2024)]|uniref:hypothetical protein n=1 Tax=Pseudomonas TaxID=286 RepID=UPI001E3F63A1|nr:hypothetical protein [Pseudomonas syringae]
MSIPPVVPPSTLRGIKRKAKSIARLRKISHSDALKIAAMESGYENFRHAQRALKRSSGEPAPSIPPSPLSAATIAIVHNVAAPNSNAQGTRMGIKMSSASDQNKQEWEADTYQKGMGAEPLQCMHCATPVAHNPPHTREMHDKSVFVQGYFRLLPKGAHGANCPFGVDEEITKIAKTSEGLIESLQKDRYQMRLVMIKEALEGAGTPKKTDGGTRANAGRTYTHNPGLLPAYINSANRALKLRTLCASNQDIEQHLELVFEGNVKVAWNQFYFESEQHMSCFHVVSQNTVQHPIAIHGQVNSVRCGLKGDPSKNVINLQMSKFRPNPDDPENGVGVEVSIWSPQTDWFKGIQDGDEVVVLGMWKPATASPAPAQRQGRYKTFTKRRLSLNMVLKAQITKVK